MRLLGQGLGERREARGIGEDHAGLEEGLHDRGRLWDGYITIFV